MTLRTVLLVLALTGLLPVSAFAADAKLTAAVAAPTRASASTARDGARYPAASLEFWGLGPRQTVSEIAPAAGYWTEILAPYAKQTGGHYIAAASFVALGAFERATLAYFDWQKKKYLPIPIDRQVEVISLTGDIVKDEQGRPSLHAHAVLGLPDGTTRGGHLQQGVVRPTLEITLTETPAHLVRRKHADLGLALIDID